MLKTTLWIVLAALAAIVLFAAMRPDTAFGSSEGFKPGPLSG